MSESKKKERSPRYPSVSLKEAIEKVSELYNREGRNFVAREIAVKSWGYKSLHGAALGLIAAIGQYGLLEQNKGQVQISEDGWTIIEAPRNSAEYKEAVKRCAMAPTIFQELSEEYGDTLPSDDNLKWNLQKRKFTVDASSTVIQVYRETMAFLKEANFDGAPESENTDTQAVTPANAGDFRHSTLAGTKTPVTYTFPLPGKTASLTIVGGEPNVKDIDLLIQFLNLFKASLGTNEMGLPNG
jgi:hypothetical protein